jgi:hypothetical protein
MFVDNSPAGAAYIVTNDKGDKVKRSAVACVLCVCVVCNTLALCVSRWLFKSFSRAQVYIPHPVHEFRVWDSAAGCVVCLCCCDVSLCCMSVLS